MKVSHALLVVLISHLITGATGLSVSSIATNRTVGVGGAYFIISRSLGAPVGAAIGIPLFFGQALSVTFYIVGFTESLTMLFPNIPQMTVSSGVLLVLGLISMKSADLALKIQYVVMAAIALSLVSFFTGWTEPSTSITSAAVSIDWWVTDGAPFAAVFAVFFPAVTGIMAGVGMSGDHGISAPHKESRRTATPKGTRRTGCPTEREDRTLLGPKQTIRRPPTRIRATSLSETPPGADSEVRGTSAPSATILNPYPIITPKATSASKEWPRGEESHGAPDNP